MGLTRGVTIGRPYSTGFAFVARQLGASYEQLAPLLSGAGYYNISPMELRKRIRAVGAALKFPVHDSPGVVPLDSDRVADLWKRWRDKYHLGMLNDNVNFDLVSFRQLVDPWLTHGT